MKTPKRIDLSQKQMNALLARAKRLLPEEDYEIVKAMADTITLLSRSVGTKNAHIRKLLKMLFGTVDLKRLQKCLKKKEKERRQIKDLRAMAETGPVATKGPRR